MKTKKLVIVGDSAFAEIAYEYFSFDSEYEVCGFSVERSYLKRSVMLGLPVVPFEELERSFSPRDHHVYVATTYTQMNRLRTRLASAAKSRGFQLASYVSSRAFVWRNVTVGEHCFIFEHNTVQPFVSIGNNVVLWSGNHIGHHSRVRDNCFISSHVVISGYCDIGENCFIGVNAALANNLTIGKDNWIGPNMAIMKDTQAGALFRTRHAAPAEMSTLQRFGIGET